MQNIKYIFGILEDNLWKMVPGHVNSVGWKITNKPFYTNIVQHIVCKFKWLKNDGLPIFVYTKSETYKTMNV
jgi:hypothetical protein